MDERRAVDELDGRGGAHQAVAGAADLTRRGEDDQQRAQPLAARGDRRSRVLGEHRAVAGGDLAQQLLDPVQQRQDVRPAGVDDGRDRPALDCGRRARAAVAHGSGCVPLRDVRIGAAGLTPTCVAMIPPAVSTQRICCSPARSNAAASPAGSGQRLTLLGR